MKKIALLFALIFINPGYAADGVGLFRNGLQAFQSNGADALLGAWYDSKSDSDTVDKLRERMVNITRRLGPVVATEVFAPCDLGEYVQRLYGVIYFEKRPLWIKAEYYSINGRSGFIALDFSLSAEDILPLERDKFSD